MKSAISNPADPIPGEHPCTTIAARRIPADRKTPLVAALALALGAAALDVAASPAASLIALNGSVLGNQARSAQLHTQFIANNGPLPAVPNRAAQVTAVSNCNDSGGGSLRDAVTTAASGDVIDLTGLGCATISLTSGSLTSGVDYLSVIGPGAGRLSIDAGNNSRAIALLGQYGILSIDGVTIRNGSYTNDDPNDPSGSAQGGCVLAAQYVTISNSVLDHCSASGKSVQGAAVHAVGALRLVNSVVTGTTATAVANDLSSTIDGGVLSGGAVYLTGSTISDASVTSTTTTSYGGVFGGGIFGMYGMILTDSMVTGVDVHVTAARDAYSKGGGVGSPTTVILERSTISNNSVHGTPGAGMNNGYIYNSAIGGGGVYIMAIPRSHPVPSTISNSTISGNSAICDGTPGAYTFGGGGGLGTWAPDPVAITNSTFSGNSTNLNGGGLYARAGGSLKLVNSTITNNSSDNGSGIADLAPRAPGSITADSTIVAGNHAFGTATPLEIVTVHADIGGTHNLIGSANVALPPGTLTSDPMLAPLANNGGATLTHALLPGSPAVDAGSNVAGLTRDQRGSGYVREFGAAADIGAYESQPSAELIFADGFE